MNQSDLARGDKMFDSVVLSQRIALSESGELQGLLTGGREKENYLFILVRGVLLKLLN